MTSNIIPSLKLESRSSVSSKGSSHQRNIRSNSPISNGKCKSKNKSESKFLIPLVPKRRGRPRVTKIQTKVEQDIQESNHTYKNQEKSKHRKGPSNLEKSIKPNKLLKNKTHHQSSLSNHLTFIVYSSQSEEDNQSRGDVASIYHKSSSSIVFVPKNQNRSTLQKQKKRILNKNNVQQNKLRLDAQIQFLFQEIQQLQNQFINSKIQKKQSCETLKAEEEVASNKSRMIQELKHKIIQIIDVQSSQSRRNVLSIVNSSVEINLTPSKKQN